MKTIETVFKEFLGEQCQRLHPETYGDYEEVIDLFVQFLNGYAYLYLSKEDKEHFNALHNKECKEEYKEYCEIFSPEHIEDSEVEGFLSYYMVRNVFLGMDFLKASVRVIHDLVKWMYTNGYMDDKVYEEVEKDVQELKADVPAAKELALLLCEYIESQPLKNTPKDSQAISKLKK
jgi:hypothetical protein